MPRTREQFSEMKDERKASILDAALPLFATSEKVSIDAICEKAKCSHGIVYHYFRNTQQILDTLLKAQTYVELKQKLFVFDGGSSYEKIEQVVSVLLNVSLKRIDVVSYLNMLIKERGKDSLYNLLSKLIRDGQIAGAIIGGEPFELVDSVFLLLKGLYLSLLLEKHPDIKVPSCETVMQLLRKPTNFGHQTL
jgi:AcrR family transcriptional regulator